MVKLEAELSGNGRPDPELIENTSAALAMVFECGEIGQMPFEGALER
jgi:hypothetical protein